MPDVSVIIPVYNTRKYLEQCVCSVLDQTFKNLEIILIDDGSPDGAGDLCDHYAEEDCRVKVIHQKNQGLSGARNTGIRVSNGRYIAFVDSDDWVHPEMYRLLYQDAEGSGAYIAACGIKKFFDTMNVPKSSPQGKLVVETGLVALSGILRCTAPGGHTAWNRLYRKELFETITFPPGRLYEDSFIVPILYANCQWTCYREAALYYYRQRPDSIMTRPFDNRSMDKLTAADSVLNFVCDHLPMLERDATCFRTVSALRIMWDLLSGGKDQFPQEYCEIKQLLQKKDIFGNSGLSLRHRILLSLFYISPRLYQKVWCFFHSR